MGSLASRSTCGGPRKANACAMSTRRWKARRTPGTLRVLRRAVKFRAAVRQSRCFPKTALPHDRQVAAAPPITDIKPRCWRSRKLLAMQVTRPWRIDCSRCKAGNASPRSLLTTAQDYYCCLTRRHSWATLGRCAICRLRMTSRSATTADARPSKAPWDHWRRTTT